MDFHSRTFGHAGPAGDDRQFGHLNVPVDFNRQGLGRQAKLPCPPNG
jgi:hypothetical protein